MQKIPFWGIFCGIYGARKNRKNKKGGKKRVARRRLPRDAAYGVAAVPIAVAGGIQTGRTEEEVVGARRTAGLGRPIVPVAARVPQRTRVDAAPGNKIQRVGRDGDFIITTRKAILSEEVSEALSRSIVARIRETPTFRADRAGSSHTRRSGTGASASRSGTPLVKRSNLVMFGFGRSQGFAISVRGRFCSRKTVARAVRIAGCARSARGPAGITGRVIIIVAEIPRIVMCIG